MEHFPLPQELANFPHQLLVLREYRLGFFVVTVEVRRRHFLFDVLDRLFAIGDAHLDFNDAISERPEPALTFFLFNGVTFSLFVALCDLWL